MDHSRFDSLTRAIGRGASRRSVLKALFGIGGAAVAPGALNETDAARSGFSGPPAFPSFPTSSCLPGRRCGSVCLGAGQVCCNGQPCSGACNTRPNPDICCTAGPACHNGCCAAGEACCNQRTCCPIGQCTTGSTCCDVADGGVVCGPDCCHPDLDPAGNRLPGHSECCDRECCFGECYGEELCCPTGRLLCEFREGPDCCEPGQNACCTTDGCCEGECFGGMDGAEFCCPVPGFVCNDNECCPTPEANCCAVDGCCEGECFGGTSPVGDTCCPAGSTLCPAEDAELCCSPDERCCVPDDDFPIACIPNTEGSCCTDEECADLTDPQNCVTGVCNQETHLCEAIVCFGEEEEITCCPGSNPDDAGQCINPMVTCCIDADCSAELCEFCNDGECTPFCDGELCCERPDGSFRCVEGEVCPQTCTIGDDCTGELPEVCCDGFCCEGVCCEFDPGVFTCEDALCCTDADCTAELCEFCTGEACVVACGDGELCCPLPNGSFRCVPTDTCPQLCAVDTECVGGQICCGGFCCASGDCCERPDGAFACRAVDPTGECCSDADCADDSIPEQCFVGVCEEDSDGDLFCQSQLACNINFEHCCEGDCISRDICCKGECPFQIPALTCCPDGSCRETCEPTTTTTPAPGCDPVACAALSFCFPNGVWRQFQCIGISCSSLPDQSCADGNPCTQDLCDDATGCSNPPVDNCDQGGGTVCCPPGWTCPIEGGSCECRQQLCDPETCAFCCSDQDCVSQELGELPCVSCTGACSRLPEGTPCEGGSCPVGAECECSIQAICLQVF